MITNFQTIPELITLRGNVPDPLPSLFTQTASNEWSGIPYKAFYERVELTAHRLKTANIQKGDRVGIIMPNDLRWEEIHLAALTIGAVVIGIDPHDHPERLKDLIQQANFSALFVDTPETIALINPQELQSLKIRVSLLSTPDSHWESWENFSHQPVVRREAIVLPSPDDLATIVYTSGTTGSLKGIPYTHGQLAIGLKSIGETYGVLKDHARFICWLPLSALFQRFANLYVMMTGGEIYFLNDPRKIMQVLPEISPDFFIGVPRFYEKVIAGIDLQIKSLPIWARLPVKGAIGIGGLYAQCKRKRKTPGPLLKLLQKISDLLVLSRIRSILGHRLQYLISGSAPISKAILEYYHALGLTVLEAYGLSENVVPMAANRRDQFQFGTVGLPVKENQLRFDSESGIHVKGPGVFQGYFNESSSYLDAQGYYDTGDYGLLEEGFLTLKGRKSELIKTSTGRRISPIHIENILRQCPDIDQLAILGHGRPQLIALINLNSKLTQQLSEEQSNSQSFLAIQKSLKEQIQKAITQLNHYERPAGYLILKFPFSVANAELTSSLKIRRKKIEENYRYWIDQLYERIAANQHNETQFLFVSQADLKQSKFIGVPRIYVMINSRLKRNLILIHMVLRAMWIQLTDLFPRMDLGPSMQQQRKVKTLSKIALLLISELSKLKGPTAKLGQLASFVSDDVHPRLRQSLAQLQANATPLKTSRVKVIIEQSLGKPWRTIFSRFEDQPLAVATMSQVHIAQLRTGEQVAVKVVIPHAKKIIHSDMKTIRFFHSLIGSISGISNSKDFVDELESLFENECNLKIEAQTQEIFRGILRDEPDVIIPKTYPDLCSEEVLTMEYIDGLSYEHFTKTARQEEKNRAAEIIAKVSIKCLGQYGVFNGDPNPGNYLFVGDKICFLDFGFVKYWSKDFTELWRQQTQAVLNNDQEAFRNASIAMGIRKIRGKLDYGVLLKHFREFSCYPWCEDREFEYSHDFLKENFNKVILYQGELRPLYFPREFAAVSRLFAGQYGIFSEWRAKRNWHKIVVQSVNKPLSSISALNN